MAGLREIFHEHKDKVRAEKEILSHAFGISDSSIADCGNNQLCARLQTLIQFHILDSRWLFWTADCSLCQLNSPLPKALTWKLYRSVKNLAK